MRDPHFKSQIALALQSGPPATGLRKPESPKSAGESAGKSAGQKGTAGRTAGSSARRPLSLENRETALLPAVPPAVPFFPALFPALSPALSGDSGFLSPVAGGPDYKSHSQCNRAIWGTRVTLKLTRALWCSLIQSLRAEATQ